MPLITTHNYFANDCFKKCNKKITNQFKEKRNIYELFAQGFDLFQFYEFFNLKKENLLLYCHTHETDTFFLNFIKNLKEQKLTNNPELLAALYGHLSHYVLDSNAHPYIVYKTGIHNPNIKESKKYMGLHTNMEMQIDAYLYEMKTKKKFKNFKIHKSLITKEKFSQELIQLLNTTYQQTFNIQNGGLKYQKGQKRMYYSYKFLIEDPSGIKTCIYKIIDWLLPFKNEIFSYYSSHITKINEKLLNNNHDIWYQPWKQNEQHLESFLDLYNKAQEECIFLFEKTHEFLNNQISETEYKKYLKNKSYLTGLPWNKKTKVYHLEF